MLRHLVRVLPDRWVGLDRDGRIGLELLGLDKGPGMQDVGKCLRDGYSTSGSPGTGLGAMERLSQRFEIYSRPGNGAAVLAQLWPDAREPAPGRTTRPQFTRA